MNLSSGRSRWRTDKAVCVAYAPAQPDASGDVSALLGYLAVARAKTNRTLDAVPPAAMTRPTPWVNWQIDVRFRLHRFASHLVEHTIQSEKILIALGWGQTEGRRIVRRVTGRIRRARGARRAGRRARSGIATCGALRVRIACCSSSPGGRP